MDLPSFLPSISPGLVPQFANNLEQKTICIIGAGPSGLAAIKTVLDSEQYKSGKWLPVVFESREEIGGIWLPAPPTSADPPLTPLYDHLAANIPHPIMSYTSYPFPPGTFLYPRASLILQYLKDYTSHFSLHTQIKFRTTVTSVTQSPPQSPRRWLVRTSTLDSYLFDLIIVCNGHYRVPRYPSLPGLNIWLDARRASHSIYYRHPLTLYRDKTLLIVGAGPSGHDLVMDLKAWARKIVYSGTSTPNIIDSDGITHRAHVASFDDLQTGSVNFVDGTKEQGIDYCILATGYRQSFPFLSPPLLHNVYPPPIPPLPKDLYNSSYSLFPLAQHMWPLQNSFPSASMAFIGILVRVAPLPLVEVQVRAVLKAFHALEKDTESGGIDKQAEAVDIMTRWEMLKAQVGEENVIKRWHRFEPMDQFDYRDRLSAFAEAEPEGQGQGTGVLPWKGFERVKDWEREFYRKKEVLRKGWLLLEKSGEAEAWVKGVGEGGVDEWVDLMRRVAKFGEEEGQARL